MEGAIEALELHRGDVPPWLPRFEGALGLAYATSGRAAAGLVLLDRSLEQAAGIGVMGGHSLLLAWLAEARLLAGRDREALDAAEQALALADRHEGRGHAAWALRARAEAEARGGDRLDAAEASYRRALAVAGELLMRPLVARCHLGLGRLYRSAGRAESAEHLETAASLLGDLHMRHWLDPAG